MKKKIVKRLIKGLFGFALLLLLGLFFCSQINLSTADLGRHIRNGEHSLKNGHPVMTNFYSYTEPEREVVNHHWGTGVIFYLLHKCCGYGGVSTFYTLLMILTFIGFFALAERLSNFHLAYILSVINLPLIVSRTEIRPEGFSYLFLSIFLFVLFLYREQKCSYRFLFALCIVQIFWVNLHIFFIFGPMLFIFFGIDEWLRGRCGFIEIDKKRLTRYAGVVIAVIGSCFVNPFGLKGVLTPFNILKEYGYMLAENQSVLFMQNRFSSNMLYVQFEIVFSLMAIIFLILAWKIKRFKYFIHLMVLGTFAFFSWSAVRGIPLFGFVTIPLVGNLLFIIFKKFKSKLSSGVLRAFVIIAFVVVCIGLANKGGAYSPYKSMNLSIVLKGEDLSVPLFSIAKNMEKLPGLMPWVNRSALFFKKNNLKGPIFNNYDIGGYLIYHLFPEERVFVDNRPEAYSVEFFKEKYIPMQEAESIWQQMDETYQFNVIYFYRRDMTPWAQPFLIRRIKDPQWAPVFVDAYSIIMLKRNNQNKSILARHELPQSLFVISE